MSVRVWPPVGSITSTSVGVYDRQRLHHVIEVPLSRLQGNDVASRMSFSGRKNVSRWPARHDVAFDTGQCSSHQVADGALQNPLGLSLHDYDGQAQPFDVNFRPIRRSLRRRRRHRWATGAPAPARRLRLLPQPTADRGQSASKLTRLKYVSASDDCRKSIPARQHRSRAARATRSTAARWMRLIALDSQQRDSRIASAH